MLSNYSIWISEMHDSNVNVMREEREELGIFYYKVLDYIYSGICYLKVKSD